MRKSELREPHCPILKHTDKEASPPAADQIPAAPPPTEERRVAFDIGDGDEGDAVKERKVAFDVGESDETETECNNANGGEWRVFFVRGRGEVSGTSKTLENCKKTCFKSQTKRRRMKLYSGSLGYPPKMHVS